MNQLERDIVFALSEEKTIQHKELAKRLGIRSKNIFEITVSMNTELLRNGAEILSFPDQKELILKITNEQAFQQYIHQLRSANYDNGGKFERTNKIVIKLLTCASPILVSVLSEDLYLSTRQIGREIVTAKKLLEKYNLALKPIGNQGVSIVGNETNKRICLFDLNPSRESVVKALSNDSSEDQEQHTFDILNNIIADTVNEKHISISDVDFDDLTNHLYIVVKRIMSGSSANKLDLPCYATEDIQDFVQVFASKIERSFSINMDLYERDYLKMLFSSKRIYNAEHADSIPQEVWLLVTDMLNFADSRYGTRLHEDFELCVKLSLHMLPLLNRLSHNLHERNPLLNNIKSEFLYEYEIAATECKVITQTCQCTVSDDEIGFIALLIKLSLDKQHRTKNKVLLICSTGRGSAELIRLYFEKSFSQYIEVLDVCSIRESQSKNLDFYDYIFSSVPISAETKTPIFRTSNFLNIGTTSKIKDMFDCSGEGKDMSEYFDANLFIPQLSAKSKLDALEKITSHIRQYRDIPDDFLDYIIRREQLMSTSFNEEVAFPHPSELITNETFACVAILENPIMWGDYKIRVVFLVSIEKTREKNLKEFYMALSRIMNNRENIRRLVNDPTYLTFMEILKRVN